MKKLLQVIGILAITTSLAHAHTQLSSSMPADKAVVATAPKEVMLHFNEAVRLTMLSVEKAGGAKQDLGPLPSAAAKDFSLAAPSLDNGHYVVRWRALSADTHAINGEFAFTVGAAERAEQSQHSGNTDHAEHSPSQHRH